MPSYVGLPVRTRGDRHSGRCALYATGQMWRRDRGARWCKKYLNRDLLVCLPTAPFVLRVCSTRCTTHFLPYYLRVTHGSVGSFYEARSTRPTLAEGRARRALGLGGGGVTSGRVGSFYFLLPYSSVVGFSSAPCISFRSPLYVVRAHLFYTFFLLDRVLSSVDL